jgi:hypothetical protein
MALKRKITKAEFDALADVLKAEYKASGDSYVLDTDDAADLIAARDREKEERRKAEKAAKDAQDALDALKDDKSRKEGDIAALEASWKAKHDAAEKRAKDAETALEGERKDRYVTQEADRIAKRFTVPGLMRDQIAKRLAVEIHDGKPLVRVLDKDGKPSAASVADFEKELVDNPEYKGIVIASKASGSADTSKQRPGGSAPKTPNSNDDDTGNLAKLDTKSLLEHMRGVVGETE